MKPHCPKTKKIPSQHGNSQNVLHKFPTLFPPTLSQQTYGAVPDVQKDLLSLLGPTDYIREAGSFLRGHTVVWKSALESCTLHTYNKKTRSLQALQT